MELPLWCGVANLGYCIFEPVFAMTDVMVMPVTDDRQWQYRPSPFLRGSRAYNWFWYLLYNVGLSCDRALRYTRGAQLEGVILQCTGVCGWHSDSDDTQRWSWTVECVSLVINGKLQLYISLWQRRRRDGDVTAVVTWTLTYLHYIIYVHVNWAHNFAFV